MKNNTARWKDSEWKFELFELLTGQKFLKPEKAYNWEGLRFPSGYLKTVGWAVTVLPLKTVSAFISKYIKQCVDLDDRFAMENFINRVKATDFKKWKAEDLGALAYIILNGKNEDVKKVATEVYKSYNDYLENQVLHIREVNEIELE
jgi:hypothetical protein